jgi:competence protein ComEC
VQVAHHGGNSSYYKSFWEKIEKNIPVVVSVGKNNYGHPNENVINSIRNLGFNIRSTNKVGCLKGKKSLRAENTNSFFDLFEDFIEIVDDANLQGDQSFRF